MAELRVLAQSRYADDSGRRSGLWFLAWSYRANLFDRSRGRFLRGITREGVMD